MISLLLTSIKPSVEGFWDCIRTLPEGTEIIHLSKGTESQALQRAVGISHGSPLFFTQVDTLFPKEWVSKHLAWHAKGYPIVSGLRIQKDRIGAAWNPFTDFKPTHFQRPNVGITGANLSISREAYERIKDQIFRLHTYWDVEIGLQAAKKRIPFIIDPSIVVVHNHPLSSLKASFYKAFLYSLYAHRITKNVYGGIRLGSDSRLKLSLKYAILEVFGVTGFYVKRIYGIETPLLVFLWYRFFFRTGQFVGLLYSILEYWFRE